MRVSVPFVFGVLFILLVSGCLSVTPEDIVKTSPAVSKFMEEYPNAEVKVTRYAPSEFNSIEDELKEDCGKSSVSAKDYYKVVIEDKESGLSMTAWVDWDSQMIECAVKEGSDVAEDSDGSETNCVSHSKVNCYDGHLYWYDSCGKKEDKKEYCDYGCENGKCKEKEQEECTSKYEMKCNEGHVYWYDSCGNKEEKKEYCEYGCENDACLEPECLDHDSFKCHDGNLYWYDSCGEIGEKKEECAYGCEDDACKEAEKECVDEDGEDPYTYGMVYIDGNTIPAEKDVCMKDIVYPVLSKYNYYLYEGICKENGDSTTKEIFCEYQCNEGKCNTEPTTSFCTEENHKCAVVPGVDAGAGIEYMMRLYGVDEDFQEAVIGLANVYKAKYVHYTAENNTATILMDGEEYTVNENDHITIYADDFEVLTVTSEFVKLHISMKDSTERNSYLYLGEEAESYVHGDYVLDDYIEGDAVEFRDFYAILSFISDNESNIYVVLENVSYS